jgi:protein involved in polysaccharide export with SLBB domain
MDRLVKAKIGGGPYRVVPGDVLELTMPTILRVVTAERLQVPDQVTAYVCRVSKKGTITLPTVGEIKAVGKTLSEIESAVIDAYYPKYAMTHPSVFARVAEYRTAKVSVTGAVENPGVYELRSDQMSLVALLMAAGGIIEEGASLIRIINSEEPEGIVPDDEETHKETIGNTLEQTLRLLTERAHKRAIEQLIEPSEIEVVVSPATYTTHNENMNLNARLIRGGKTVSGKLENPEPFVLPVKGLNIPFADVALRDADSVIVERLREPLITVVGLVNRPGNFPYPPDVEYNLMHALGFASGLNVTAEPRYATVYRLRADGITVSATFNIIGLAKSADPTDALSVQLKPYDIVAVEHTPRTRAKIFWDRVFRFYISTHVGLEDIFGEY